MNFDDLPEAIRKKLALVLRDHPITVSEYNQFRELLYTKIVKLVDTEIYDLQKSVKKGSN